MIGFDKEWAKAASLGDLWYEICQQHTMAVSTGRPEFRVAREQYLEVYHSRGGKKKEPKVIV